MSQVADEQQLRAEGTHFLWLQSSTIWSQMSSLWGNGWRELCNHSDTLLTCWESALHRLGPQLRGCLANHPGHTSGKRDGAGRRWLLGIQQMLLLLLSSLLSLPQSLMRTWVYKCYHLSPSPPSWRREWRFYNYMCLRVCIKKALCINIKVIKVRTPKKILVSVQSLRKIF